MKALFQRGDLVRVLENPCGFPTYTARVKWIDVSGESARAVYEAHDFAEEDIPLQFLRLIYRPVLTFF